MKTNGYVLTGKLSLLIAALTLVLTAAGAQADYRDSLSDPSETCEQYVLRHGFADWPVGERQLLENDPTILNSLISFYETNEGRPYWFLIAENWMACGLYSLSDGRSYTGWQVGDLNLDGIVNYDDLVTYAKIQMGL